MTSDKAAIGIDTGGTTTKGGIVTSDGEVLARARRPTDPTAGTKGIIAVTDELLGRARDEGIDLEAIGVGATGFIYAPSGSVTFSPNLAYDDPNIAAAIHARSGLPVVVDNDANVAAWGERAYGTAVGSDEIVLLTIGTGIGSGIVTRGKLLRGYSGSAAEVGHVVIDPDGPQCGCGVRGCLEQFSSGQAVARMGREAVEEDPSSSILDFAGSPELITGEHVAKAAREMDLTAREILRRAGEYLGIGLSNVANLFDPEVIVLGGSVIGAGEPFLGPARDRLFAMTSAQLRRPMRLDVTALGDDAGVVGAAALAFDEAVLPSGAPGGRPEEPE